MRVGIDVENRSEAEAVQRSLEDPLMKTVVIMNGLLQALGSAPARERALHLLNTLNEPQFQQAPAGNNGDLGRLHDAGASPV